MMVGLMTPKMPAPWQRQINCCRAELAQPAIGADGWLDAERDFVITMMRMVSTRPR
jgi:hypothetical protein